jgi:hypothetical protein
MRARVATACVILAALAGACSSGGAAGSSAPATHATSGPSVQPAAQPANCPKQLGGGHFGLGTKVKITPQGFDPQILVTGMNLAVTWTNASSKPQSVHFDNWGAPVDSGPIAPGASWTFKAGHTGSVLYHSTLDGSLCGQLEIQLTGNGSEPGG